MERDNRFIEGDISDCLDPWSYCSFADCAV
jgi:hypothetical protein